MKVSIVCIVLVGCVALAACNPLGLDDGWSHGAEQGCGGHLDYTSWAETPSNHGCSECGALECDGGHIETLDHLSGTTDCGCSACAAPAWESSCTGASNCGCGSCGQVTVKKLKPFVIPADQSKGRLIIHHGKPILIKPSVTKFFVPASPVVVEPHLISHPAQVNVQPRVSSSCSAPVQVKPVVVRVVKEVKSCGGSDSLSGGLISCSNDSPCNNHGCSSCGGGNWHY